jgi:hypothetical protein
MSSTDKPDNDDVNSRFDADTESWRKQFWNDDGAKPDAKLNKGNGADADPEPKTAAAPDFPTLAEEAFHGPVGEIVRVIEPHTESDPALLLISGLVYFGNAIGHGPHHVVEGTPHYSNFYALFVGSTSKARKGTGDGRVRQIFNVAAHDWCKFRIRSGGISSGEGLINEVRDPTAKMVDGELEVIDEGVEDKRLLVVQSEFGGALEVLKRDGSMLSAVLRDGWDGRDLGTLVKNRPVRATGPHISIIGHITKSELVYLMDQVSMANGFGNRFLFACVRRSKSLPFGGSLSLGEVTRLGTELGFAIERARQIEEVGWGTSGAEGWKSIYGELSGARPGLIGALTARAEAQVVRLATVYALWDGSTSIEPPHLMAAMAVQDFCEASVRYVFGEKIGNSTADTILAALKNAPDGLTRTEIRDLFNRNAQSGATATALQELQALGLATVSRRTATGRGRPTEVWTYAH